MVIRSHLLNSLKDFFHRRWRSRQLCMPIPAIRAIWTKSQLVHVTLLDILIGVLIHTILLAAFPVKPKKPAHWHPGFVVLVEESAGVTLHTQAPEPVPADRLSEATPPRMVSRRRRRIGSTCGRCGDGVVGGPAAARCAGGVGVDYGYRCGGVGGASVEAALEVEAQNAVPVVH